MTSTEKPSPERIKKQIEDAYSEAISNRFTSWSRGGSGIDHLVQGVKLYGRDAGMDFVDSHLSEITREALEEARCKKPSLTLPTYQFGQSAIAGMMDRLAELTALKVSMSGKAVVLTWAEANPGLV